MTLTKFTGQYEELFANCVMHWTGNDQTSNGFPILPTGVTVTPNGTWSNDLDLGNNKSVLKFDGSTNYISLTNNDAWDFDSNQDFTITFWAKYIIAPPESTIAATCPGTWTSAGWLLSIGWQSRYAFHADIGNIASVTSVLSWTSGQWYHFVVVRNSGVITLYRDMIQTSQATITNAIISTNPLTIGYDGARASVLANNNIKDLMIYKGRALTQPEIITLMRKTHPLNAVGDFRPTLSGIRGVE